ncbi:phage SPO1 DNA polymerase domain protein [Pseudomonas fluorescens Q2-87]|uniref:Phage SPO1 DNA polymerase domain protein n=1 Tax=Pseudomonas fluorescens (strain Q2-87) TaxID=1038922 RepID=J2YE77_PSEFQ|nr:phage SPO1 DNA polymerase domain protein [Pseudomonas fluorescens Q2-87]
MLSMQLQAPMPARSTPFLQAVPARAAILQADELPRLQTHHQPAPALDDDQSADMAAPYSHHTQQQLLWRQS